MGDFKDAAQCPLQMRRLIKDLENSEGTHPLSSLFIRDKGDIRFFTRRTQNWQWPPAVKARDSIQHRLNSYSSFGPNGLVLYYGNIVTDDGKEKHVLIEFEPFKPITRFRFHHQRKFNTEGLQHMLKDDDKFGFIIVDGNGALYGTVQGNHQETLQTFPVDLPSKHGRGGQSALRFARLRLEKRHNYVRKVAEMATQLFVPDGKQPNIKGLIVAGSAEFKTNLTTSKLFDPRLDEILIKPLLDVAYGGQNGFNQAIQLASDSLKEVKFVQEKKLVSQFLDEVDRDTGRCCYGIKETINLLEMSAVDTLICWESLDDLHDEISIVRIAEQCEAFGTKFECISDRSAEGSQFCKGFGGLGGLLRYPVRMEFVEPDFAVDGDDAGDDEGHDESDPDFM